MSSSGGQYYQSQIFTKRKVSEIEKAIYPQVSELPGAILYEPIKTEPGPGEDGYPVIRKPSEWEQIPDKTESHLFKDNVRQIDFVLAYSDADETTKKKRRRKVFHKNLIEEGLELEFEDKTQSESGQIYYVKIHSPWDLLSRYAEILKLKKPIKGFVYIRGGEVWKEAPSWIKNDIFKRFGFHNPFNYDEELIPPEPECFSAGFSVQRQEMFLIKDRDTFFTPAQRSLIVWEILKRAKYSSKDLGFGISRLLANGTYLAAYPLHDGPYDRELESGKNCDRRLLYLEWGRSAKWYKKQPLHLIRRYFGDKMALYFAWLGFYTEMLIPAAMMGIFTFICGIFFVYSDYNKPSDEICDDNLAGNTTMCPLCDGACFFKKLSDSCFNSKMAFLFDNPMTVIFSIGMSFWATMFLELWKRKQVVLQWQWDMESYDEEEEVRPQYEELVKNIKINPVTKKKEPHLPFWNKLSRCVAANSVLLLMLFLVLAAVLGVILYRLVVAAVMYQSDSELVYKNARMVTSVTAATLNLIVIMLLNYLYEKIVYFLTSLELPRTEMEFEDSFTLKMFLFQFINFYSSLIYIAFFKGRFFYHPGDTEARENILMKLRYDMCDPAGCLFELCVQLAIIMVGKQLISNGVELFIPIIKVWWNKRHNKDSPKQVYTRWEQDYDLSEFTRLSLFGEYLEMVIQYGFITLFVAAFPLAPFFALVNNIFEIRLDAYKYLTKSRRPLPQRVQDIGIWFNILKAITYSSVLTNALVISYTSDFIPRLVYLYGYSMGSLEGYIVDTLSIFNVSEYATGMGPSKEMYKGEEWPVVCHYRAYRNPPDSPERYEITIQFWHVFTARLAFIIIFEHIVFVLTWIIAWAIPDVPVEIKNQIKMEKKVEKETLFQAEMKKIREERMKNRAQLGKDVDLGDGLQVDPSPCGSSSSSRAPSRNSQIALQDADS